LRPRRKAKTEKEGEKQPAQPKKFAAFSVSDSHSIETAYQRLLEGAEKQRANPPSKRKLSSESGNSEETHVPVNEDFLFDVDIAERELSPVYWLGPVYEVRRGTWFYQEGSTLKPCEENLAAQLEDGYLKTRPWLNTKSTPRARSASPARNTITPRRSKENLKASSGAQGAAPARQYRLFGSYMNSVATYEDASTVWLTSDGMLSWVTSTVYERFSAGAHRGGVKLVRGYEAGKSRDESRPATPVEAPELLKLDDKQQKLLKRRSAPPSTKAQETADTSSAAEETRQSRDRERQLQRQLSSFSRDPDKREEEIREREEKEIQDDYGGQAGEKQNRKIEHLVLVTHGIGQLLGLR
jgi:hypothetical protein